MSERGQRQTLRVGRVAAEVTLIKSSSQPREAQYETRRVSQLAAKHDQEREALERHHQHERELFDALNGEDQTATTVTVAEAVEQVKDEMRRGATNPDGDFVDLTEQLAAIDQRCLIDGIDIAATVVPGAIQTMWVRDSHYVAPAGVGAPKVLGLLWHGLRDEGRVALVRWTKKTNQALGALVARGTRARPYLVLLELEWAANLRETPARCDLSTGLGATTAEERASVKKFVAAYAEKPDMIPLLRDERTAQRAELLEAVRDGRKWEPPVAAPRPADDLIDFLG